MFTLPRILPADPCAPEAHLPRQRPLQYGWLARAILAFEGGSAPRITATKPKRAPWRGLGLSPAAFAS